MYRFKIIDMAVGLAVGAALTMLIGLLPSGCSSDQEQQPERPVASAIQSAPSLPITCFIEGHLVARSCHSGEFPTCPAEDSPRHDGQPCFWINRNGDGVLWSDGVAAPDER